MAACLCKHWQGEGKVTTVEYTYEQKIAFIKSLYCPARAVSAETGCSWELILAQAAGETGWGEKTLPGTNNVFNIKSSAQWKGSADRPELN